MNLLKPHQGEILSFYSLIAKITIYLAIEAPKILLLVKKITILTENKDFADDFLKKVSKNNA